MTQNSKLIEDVIVPIKGTGKYLEVKSLGFPLNPTNVSFYYAIREQIEEDQNGDIVLKVGAVLLEGNLVMDKPTYDNWGDDDDYVWNWVATQLGLTFVTEP